MDITEFRAGLGAWLDEHADELAPPFAPPGTLDEHVAQMQRVKALLHAAGWMRWGWPERVGGLGGSPILRTELGAQLVGRDLIDPGTFSLVEVLAPTLVDFAPAELAADVVPRLLAGEEMWCQGFSEPATGSDLGALTCRAVPDGEPESAATWIVNGQKVWTSLAQYSERCVLLTRTGSMESRHRGITAFFVDMDTPGITVRPLEAMHGVLEFSEVFYDDVLVPFDRTLGDEGQGWAVAMSLLPYERSTALWHRGALLHRRLGEVLSHAAAGAVTATEVGEAFQHLYAFRARSRATQHRLHAGDQLGPETSVDKILIATAEQAVFDLAADGLAELVALGDDRDADRWRAEYLYSRAATIYGGSSEIQRNIVARRLLDLGPER
jgi:alkylation response protein AidB-like acyl-CoA dehydrogenase